MGELIAGERIRQGQACVLRDGKFYVQRSQTGEQLTEDLFAARANFEEGDPVEVHYDNKTLSQATRAL